MAPFDFQESLHGPSERDIERADLKSLESSDRGSSPVWKILALAIALVSAAAMIANILLPAFASHPSTPEPPVRQPARVVGVINGTTLIVETPDGRHIVRYIGVEPNLPGSAYAEYAADVSRALVGGKDVLLEADTVDRDGDVLLRYVVVDDTPVNLVIVAAGVARADLEGPNEKYRDLFRQFQESAKSQQLGIWSGAQASQPF